MTNRCSRQRTPAWLSHAAKIWPHASTRKRRRPSLAEGKTVATLKSTEWKRLACDCGNSRFGTQKCNLTLALRTLQRVSNRQNRREFLLSPRTVAVDRHRVSGSRNRGEPIARLRDFGTRLHNEAHFPYGFCDWLLCCREHHHILARISSERRCAKRKCEHHDCTSNRPGARATESAFYFHAVIVSPGNDRCKLISIGFAHKE